MRRTYYSNFFSVFQSVGKKVKILQLPFWLFPGVTYLQFVRMRRWRRWWTKWTELLTDCQIAISLNTFSSRNADAIQWNSLKSTNELQDRKRLSILQFWWLCPYVQQVLIIETNLLTILKTEKNMKMDTITMGNWPMKAEKRGKMQNSCQVKRKQILLN